MLTDTTRLAVLGGAVTRGTALPDWPPRSADARDALLEVFDSGHWWQSGGGASERLEAALAEWFDVPRAICVSNGTVALELAFRACGIGPGDEVLVPAITFVSSAAAVATVGAVPVAVDVRADTLNVDIDALGESLSPRTRALVVVHLAGQPADLARARAFCDLHDLLLIEDSAQAASAEWDGERVGSVGDLTTLSFQAGKLLSGGEGGAVLIRAPRELAASIERTANCGRSRGDSSYRHVELGTNARISEFSAALVLSQLPQLNERATKRSDTFDRVLEALGEEVVSSAPEVTRDDHYMVLLRVPSEALVRGLTNRAYAEILTSEGLPSQVLYPPWHELPSFTHVPRRSMVAERVARETVWIHHRALLDETFVDHLASARGKLLIQLDEVVRWQEWRYPDALGTA